MKITQRLGVLVAVPLCAVTGFGALALTTAASDAISAGRLWSLINTSNAAADLIGRLQAERTGAALYLTTPASSPRAATLASDLNALMDTTDAAAGRFRSLSGTLGSVPKSTREMLDRIDTEIAGLQGLRTATASTTTPPPALSAVLFQYRILIADLIAFQSDVAQAGSAPSYIATRLTSATTLAKAAEYSGQEESIVLRVAGTPLTQAAQQDIAVARTGYAGTFETFDTVASLAWQEVPDQALTGSDVLLARTFEDAIARAPIGKPLNVAPQQWSVSMSARISRLENVEQGINAETLATVAQIRQHQRWLAGVEAASIAGTILAALLISLRLGRPMIRGLRALQEGAHAVAYEHLPSAVESLRRGSGLTGLTPDEFARRHVGGEAISVKGDDEVAAVARAFNAVHHEAVRTAAEQALLRAGVGAAFIALARRSERLTGALTSELDKAERDEQDPDRLARLFVLDHLAARMSRNNESLLVLGGEGTARVRDQGAPLIDVVRGALGRIERYSRVDPANIDPSVQIAPGAVDHLVHLCAELLDNATTFSSPDTRVSIEASILADRLILQIADRGIGLAGPQRDELNARLSAPRNVDINSVRAMGLTVAALLASWYGIAVELRPRPDGGTIAEVTLPPTLYWAPAMGRMPEMAPAAAEPQAVAPGPVNPSPLYADPVYPEPAYTEPVYPPDSTFPEAGYTVQMYPEDSTFPNGYAQTPYPAPASPLTPASAPPQAPAHAAPLPRPRSEDSPQLSPWLGGPIPTAPPQAAQAYVDVDPYAQPYAQPPREAAMAQAHAPEPEPQQYAAPPAAGPAPAGAAAPQPQTTLHGLPKRVPLARIPSEAFDTDPDSAQAAEPVERDPSQVSASMAAYARGLGARTPEQSPRFDVYPPMSSTGNST